MDLHTATPPSTPKIVKPSIPTCVPDELPAQFIMQELSQPWWILRAMIKLVPKKVQK